MNRQLFKFRIAFKNIIKNKARSLVVLFLMVLLVVLSLINFGSYSYIEKIFYYEYQEKYQNVDLIISYDQYTDSRIINNRYLLDEFSNYLNFSSSYFNLYSLVEFNNESSYVNLYSSDLEGFENVMNIDINSLDKNDIFITKSFATKNNLNLGDKITLVLGQKELIYKVKMIIADQGLFSNDSVFVEKTRLLDDVFIFSSPNLGNIIYLSIKPEYEHDDVIENIKGHEHFKNKLMTKAIDQDKIRASTIYSSSIFLGVSIILLIGVYIIFRSVLPLLFRDFNQQVGVIKILGGSDVFSFEIWLIQFFINLLIAYPVGLILTKIISNFGAKAYGLKSKISISEFAILGSLGFILILTLVEVVGRYFIMKKSSDVDLSQNFKFEIKKPKIILIVGIICLISLNLFNKSKTKELFNLILIVFACLVIIPFLLSLLGKIIKRSNSLFSLFNLKYITSSRVVHASSKVIYISMIMIVVAMLSLSVFKKRLVEITDGIEFNYFLANINDYEPALKTELISSYDISKIEEAVIFRDVINILEKNERNLQFLISMDPKKIGEYFNLKINEDLIVKLLETNKQAIILPIQYKKAYSLNESDIFSVKVSPNIDVIDFEIVGFYDSANTFVYFTNLHLSDNFKNEKLINSLLMYADKSVEKQIVKQCGSKMYYLFNIDEFLTIQVNKYTKIMTFVILLIWLLIICFMIVIINHTSILFYSIKEDIAKLIVLGSNIHDFIKSYILEGLVILGLTSVFAFVSLSLIIPRIGSLMILVGTYYKFEYSLVQLLMYLLLGVGLFFSSYIYLIFKIKKIDVSMETKMF